MKTENKNSNYDYSDSYDYDNYYIYDIDYNDKDNEYNLNLHNYYNIYDDIENDDDYDEQQNIYDDNDDIIGGRFAYHGQYPSIVHLSVGCGGTILNEKWILSAAHCFKNGLRTEVVAGEWNLNLIDSSEQKSMVSFFICLPYF